MYMLIYVHDLMYSSKPDTDTRNTCIHHAHGHHNLNYRDKEVLYTGRDSDDQGASAKCYTSINIIIIGDGLQNQNTSALPLAFLHDKRHI